MVNGAAQAQGVRYALPFLYDDGFCMGTGLNILVVDDDVDNAFSLGELFELEGHTARVVHDGQSAIDAYLHTDFDLAFMDVMMPGKNGVESFIEIRRMKPQAKVFMMTGYSVEELLRQATREGALGVIEKPLAVEEVLRMAENVGAGGLLVASPLACSSDLGDALHATVSRSGRSCRLVRDTREISAEGPLESIVVIDTPHPLIDSVSCYAAFRKMLRVPTTIIIPPAKKTAAKLRIGKWDVGITGILNKPFDPLELLNRLPQLAM
jgi:two-component system, NtrC family, response regulator HydG